MTWVSYKWAQKFDCDVPKIEICDFGLFSEAHHHYVEIWGRVRKHEYISPRLITPSILNTHLSYGIGLVCV